MNLFQKPTSNTVAFIINNRRLLISWLMLLSICAILLHVLHTGSPLQAKVESLSERSSITHNNIAVEAPSSTNESLTDSSNDTDYTIPDHELLKESVTDQLDEAAALDGQWQNYEVQSGDTLSGIFSGFGLSNDDLYDLLAVDKDHLLSKLRPRQELEFLIDKNNQLQKLVLALDSEQSKTFARDDQSYQVSTTKKVGRWSSHRLEGMITDNFYNSARRAGLSPGQIQKIAEIFQWKINFSRDLRKGDQFTVLVDQKIIENQKVGTPRITGIELSVAKREYSAFLFSNDQYYDADGFSLNRSFRRYPFGKVYRISSSFDLHRLHPVTRRVQPHYGTDFALPSGTSVLAAADGHVVFAGYHRLAGNYIVIRHGRKYSTRYLHLKKILVRRGQRVSLGQKIALSGNTGRTTGAHLHYEVRIYNRPVNPMTAQLPASKRIPKQERSSFLAKVNQYQQQMQG